MDLEIQEVKQVTLRYLYGKFNLSVLQFSHFFAQKYDVPHVGGRRANHELSCVVYFLSSSPRYREQGVFPFTYRGEDTRSTSGLRPHDQGHDVHFRGHWILSLFRSDLLLSSSVCHPDFFTQTLSILVERYVHRISSLSSW